MGSEPSVRESYRLRADAVVVNRDDGAIVMRQGRYELALDAPGMGPRALLLRLADRWVDELEVNRIVAGVAGESRILYAQVLLRRLVAHSWLRRRLSLADRPLLEIVPRALGAGSLPASVRHDPAEAYRMSRFAALRADRGVLLAHSPLSTVACALPDPRIAGALATAAADGLDAAGLAEAAQLPPSTAGVVMDELLSAGIVVSGDQSAAHETQAPWAFWAPEELKMHERSRPGHHTLPVGGTYRLRGVVEPAPLPRMFDGAPAVQLPVPDLELAAKNDDSLTAVIQARRSIREHDDDAPITLEQLAEFLYRVGHTEYGGEAGGQELGRRAYPSGGSICELEIYPLVTRCTGVTAGLYHYDGTGHRLELVAGLNNRSQQVLGYARAASATARDPQVLLVITGRVPRLMWKYEGMGYAMMLKHVGILTELMYLVATAMRLAPCALGAGDSDAFARLSGLDPLTEPSVADFLLGSSPANLSGQASEER